MALKIWLNGSMKKIDTNLHKPVTFINGDKYKLDKAWTFINGVKHEIWGAGGILIDYISSTGILGGGDIFSISENWLNCSRNNNVYRIDISNISNPVLIQNVAWGSVINANCYQMTSSNNIFESWNGSNNTGYKLSENKETGEIQVLSSGQLTASESGTKGLIGCTNSNIITKIDVLVSLHPVQLHKTRFYWNDTFKYENYNSYNGLVQNGDNTYLVKSYTSGAGYIVWLANESGLTQQSWTEQTPIQGAYYNNGYIYAYTDSQITKRGINDLSNVLEYYDAGLNKKVKLLGEIDNNLYVLSLPTTVNPDSEIKLILLDSSDLSVVMEKTLENDPFNENYGNPTFWVNCTFKPQVSQTGFLGVSTYNASTLGLRVVRFSGLI
jgi:hypothetical protein